MSDAELATLMIMRRDTLGEEAIARIEIMRCGPPKVDL